MEMRDILLFFSLKYNGNWEEIYDAIDRKEEVSPKEVMEQSRIFENKYITILDKEYPEQLQKILNPPFVIFYKGKRELLERNQTIYPISAYQLEEGDMSKIKQKFEGSNLTTICGNGIAYEKQLLKNITNKEMIVIKDSGIENHDVLEIDLENEILKNDGLIISEYPYKVETSKSRWIMSNRIKVGLTKSTLILSYSEKEEEFWKLICASANYGNDIYALFTEGRNNKDEKLIIEYGARKINNLSEVKI